MRRAEPLGHPKVVSKLTLYETCCTRARQFRLNGSVSAEPPARDAVQTRPHSFNAAAAGRFLGTICRIPVPPFVDIVKAGRPARSKTDTRGVMAQYLVAIYRPKNYDPAVSEDEAMDREIDALNDEMKAAGVRVFVGGLQPESSARSLRLQPAGKVLITDGPYAETKEHIGGFWVLEAAGLDEAVAWGRKAAVACRASVEVRPFH